MKRAWTGLLLALLLLPAGVTAGEIRKWVDATGRVHFGDDAAAPGRSETVRPRRGNFLDGGRPAATTAGADEAPRSWAHTVRSEILPAAPGTGPAKATRLADAGGPDCVPVENKKISATTGRIVRMRRLPCQPGVAPVEISPY